METLSTYLNITPETLDKLFVSGAIFLVLTLVRLILNRAIRKGVDDARRTYNYRRAVLYSYTILLVLIIGPIWLRGIASFSTFLGLASAGIAIAMRDTIANMAAWLFIVSRKPFSVGDRIQIGETAGDVIDIRFFQFSMVEIGNWVDADQSTGRIVHVPNSKVLSEPLANYHIGFRYIWNEVPVLVTFESDWRRAKEILVGIADKCAEEFSSGAREQIRRASEKYLIFYGKLTPIVYTTVQESGVLLTIRYMVEPRKRRSSVERIWEAVLNAFEKEAGIELAYPTTRFYAAGENEVGPVSSQGTS